MKLYVGNLPYDVKDSDLTDIFVPFGEVESVKIITDRYTGASKGFGFVEMSSRKEGELAIKELNGKTIRNRQIVVNEARSREERGRSGRQRPRGSGRGRF